MCQHCGRVIGGQLGECSGMGNAGTVFYILASLVCDRFHQLLA